MRTAAAAFAALGLVAACSSPEEMQSARAAVSEIRAAFDAGDTAAFYAHTTEGYRSVTSAEQTAQLVTALRVAVGECQPAGEPSSTNWNRNTSGYFITLTYVRTCANGPLTETYVLSMATNPPRLHGFNFNSPALMSAILQQSAQQPAQAESSASDKPQAVSAAQ
jgi:hypothetical protein